VQAKKSPCFSFSFTFQVYRYFTACMDTHTQTVHDTNDVCVSAETQNKTTHNTPISGLCAPQHLAGQCTVHEQCAFKSHTHHIRPTSTIRYTGMSSTNADAFTKHIACIAEMNDKLTLSYATLNSMVSAEPLGTGRIYGDRNPGFVKGDIFVPTITMLEQTNKVVNSESRRQ